MRLAIDTRRWRLLRRLPRYSLLSLTELLLLAVLAMQSARLLWVVVTPVGPLGEWRPAAGPDIERARAALSGGFDPFFRLRRTAGTTNVTSLSLKLFGTRVDEATGRGSAIIAGQDDVQTNYSVGEDIQPGVTLKSVAYDHVVISRGGADETLYIDQSGSAPVVQAGSPPPPPMGAIMPSTPPSEGIRLSELQGMSLAPRQSGGRVTGLVPRGDPAMLAHLGLQPGDVVVQVAGRPVNGPEDVQRAAAALAKGGNLSISVERGASIAPVAIAISGP